MMEDVKVLDKEHEFGSVVIASFTSLDDARLFVVAKAEKENRSPETGFEIFTGHLAYSVD